MLRYLPVVPSSKRSICAPVLPFSLASRNHLIKEGTSDAAVLLVAELNTIRNELLQRLYWLVLIIRYWLTFILAYLGAISTLIIQGKWNSYYDLVLLPFPFVAMVFAMAVVYDYEWICLLITYERDWIKPAVSTQSRNTATLNFTDYAKNESEKAFTKPPGESRVAGCLRTFNKWQSNFFPFFIFGLPVLACYAALLYQTIQVAKEPCKIDWVQIWIVLGSLLLCYATGLWGARTYDRFKK